MGGSGTDSQTLSGSDSQLIQQLRDEYDLLWRSNTRPNLTQFLRRKNVGTIPRLIVALIALDIDRRIEAGENPVRADYQSLCNNSDPEFHSMLSDLDATISPAQAIPTRPAPRENSQFADYELLNELGRGGMGIVYRARQLKDDQIVAIKIMREGRFSKRNTIARFRKEAKATAELDHANIVKVFDIGEHEGWNYMSMQLIDGPSLADIVQESGPMAPNQAATIMRSISGAIAFSNSNGVLHRDLKPANVLLDKNRTPYVIDYGLVKRLGSETAITKTGHVVGTAEYLAPEMVAQDIMNLERLPFAETDDSIVIESSSSGISAASDDSSLYSESTREIQSTGRREATEAVDVYGLGATLYALLTGRPPHSAHSSRDVLRHVAEHDPVPPRELNPAVPIELDTICRKCMQRNPRHRFASAREVTEELSRFLEGQPIVTKRESIWRRALKFLEQKKVMMLIIAGLLAFSILSASGWIQARSHLWESKISEAKSLLLSDKPGRRFKTLDAVKQAAEIRTTVELRDLAVSAMALSDLRVAALTDANPNFGWAIDSRFETYATSDKFGNVSIRRMEDNQLLIRLPAPDPDRGDAVSSDKENDRDLHHQPAFELELNASGTFLAAKYRRPAEEPDSPEQFRMWNLKTGTVLQSAPEVIQGVAWCFSDDGKIAAVAEEEGVVRMIDLAEDRIIHTFFQGDWMGNIALSPDGERMAIARGEPATVDVFEVDSGDKLKTLQLEDTTRGICWSPDGRQLATTSSRELTLWDFESSQKIWTRVGHESAVVKVTFNSTGTTIASAGWDGKVCLWRVSDGAQLIETAGKTWIRFRDDDQQLAGAVSDQKVAVWDLSLAPEFKVIDGHEGPNGPHYIDFSRCGRYLASAGIDGLKVWESANPQRPPTVLRSEAVGSCQFTDDGNELVAVGIARVHRWRFQISDEGIQFGTRAAFSLEQADQSQAKLFELDQSGTKLALLESFDGRVKLFDMNDSQDGEEVVGEFVDLGGIGSVSLSPNGKLLATGTWNRRANTLVWDTATRKVVQKIPSGDAHVLFAPDGKQLVVGSEEKFELFDVSDWKSVSILPRNGATLRGPAAFSEDGDFLAIAITHETIQLIDRTTGEKRALLKSPKPELISAICFSADGRYLAAACESHVVHLWDLQKIRDGLQEIGLNWSPR